MITSSKFGIITQKLNLKEITYCLLSFGRKYGFNFNEHKNDKVGILRAFVKKHKS